MDPVAYRIKFLAHHRSGNKWWVLFDSTNWILGASTRPTITLIVFATQSRISHIHCAQRSSNPVEVPIIGCVTLSTSTVQFNGSMVAWIWPTLLFRNAKFWNWSRPKWFKIGTILASSLWLHSDVVASPPKS
jgi:hypothetical protein